jgi:hypothetical protein
MEKFLDEEQGWKATAKQEGKMSEIVIFLKSF